MQSRASRQLSLYRKPDVNALFQLYMCLTVAEKALSKNYATISLTCQFVVSLESRNFSRYLTLTTVLLEVMLVGVII